MRPPTWKLQTNGAAPRSCGARAKGGSNRCDCWSDCPRAARATRAPLHPGHTTRTPTTATPLVLPQVERGAALDTLDKYGTSAFRWAAQTKNDSCAQHLVASGAKYMEEAQISSGAHPAPRAGPVSAALHVAPPTEAPARAVPLSRAQKSTGRCSR